MFGDFDKNMELEPRDFTQQPNFSSKVLNKEYPPTVDGAIKMATDILAHERKIWEKTIVCQGGEN